MGPWVLPANSENAAAKAEEVALSIAERLSDLERLRQSVFNSSEQSPYFAWHNYGFASGHAGLSVLWAHLDRCYPKAGWARIAHQNLQFAVNDIESAQYISPSLFGGLSGIAFAAYYAANGEPRYANLLCKLDSHLVRLVAPTLRFFDGPEPVFGVPVQIFDLISGLSGTALYLLSRYGTSQATDDVLLAILRSFIRLASEKGGLPAWHTPKSFLQPNDTMTDAFPDGHLNLGLAHGIPGPLGVLALAKLSGFDIGGLDRAIEYLATWLLNNRHDDEWGSNWPCGVALITEGDQITPGSASDVSPAHAGWCYGSPGLSRSIYLSGVATNNQKLCDAAIEAIESVMTRPRAARALYSPTFCHGIAGLLQISMRYINDRRESPLETECLNILSDLLSYYDDATLLGYQSRTSEGSVVDSPALLDGAAGVALALLSVCHPVEPAWDRAFLLS